MLLGIGVDIIHLPRVSALLSRHSSAKFARRILSSQELSEWVLIQRDDQQKQVRFLAVRWAVKEAAYKALYPTVKPTWKELSYHGLAKSGEKPRLLYRPFEEEHARKIDSLHVSVSHDGDYATAFVIAEGNM